MTILSKDRNSIDCRVKNDVFGVGFLVTFVYGDPIRSARMMNWETFRLLGSRRHEPWICAGDFNEITHHSEKIGGRRKEQYTIDTFTRLIEDIHMEDLGFKGQMHTWSNNRRGVDRIVERLDRFLGNMTWCERFPSAQCVNRVAIGSDHSPVELIIDDMDAKGRRRFRFENMWLERQDCLDLIRASWERTGLAETIGDLEPKLDDCRRSLIS